jgi:peptide deformylase
MKYLTLTFCVLAMYGLFSCKLSQPFTAADVAFISAGSAETAFRVLQISNREDSIVLRRPCADVRHFAGDTVFQLFIARLKATLVASEGVGIAAPQVGLDKNVFLFMRIDKPEHPVCVAINPKIVHHPDTTVCFARDGCLSIPGVAGNSVRYPWIEVEYCDEKGKKVRERLEGYRRQADFTSVIFQHEYDHTTGVLFIDKLCDAPTGALAR